MRQEDLRLLEPAELVARLRQAVTEAQEAGLIERCAVRGKRIVLHLGKEKVSLTACQALTYLRAALDGLEPRLRTRRDHGQR